MTRYAKRKLKYSFNENFNLLPYVEWDQFVALTGAQANEGYVIVSRIHQPLWNLFLAYQVPNLICHE
jgi:hypothetical protein